VTHPECSKNVFTGFPVSPSKVFTAPSAICRHWYSTNSDCDLVNNCHTETLW